MKVEKELESFLTKEKFSDKSWQERGLIPSPKATVDLMSAAIDDITNKVKSAYQERRSKGSIKKIITNSIEGLQNDGQFDTEEKDFLIDLICDLALIFNIKLEDPIVKWFSYHEETEHVKQKCDYCGVYLTTLIQTKTEEINYLAWDIVKCDNCGGLNLLTLDPHIKKCTGQGYEFVKQLDKNKYDKEAALRMLNKMREKTGR